MVSLLHQQGMSPQILAVSGSSRFWMVLKGLVRDHCDTVAGERKHSAGMLSLYHADKDMKKVSGFLPYLTLCIAYPFDIYPSYCFLILLHFMKLFQYVFSYHSYFYKFPFRSCLSWVNVNSPDLKRECLYFVF